MLIVCEQAVLALGKIISHKPHLRGYLIQHGVVKLLLTFIKSKKPILFLRIVTWSIQNLCENKEPPLPIDTILKLLPALNGLIEHTSERWLKKKKFNMASPELMSLRRICFLCFIRRFWNQVFTCVSLRPSAEASSTRSGVDRYRWASNRFSNPVSCGSLNTVRAFLLRQCRNVLTPIPIPKAISGTGHPLPPNKWAPLNKPIVEQHKY